MDEEARMKTRYWAIPPEEYFYEQVWIPVLSDKGGYPRYRHFVNHMVKRIRAGNSSALEIQKFVNLIGSKRHPQFLTLAEEELREMNVEGLGEVDGPSDPNNQHFLLFWYAFKDLERKHKQSTHRTAADADALRLGREHGTPAGTMTEAGFIQSVSAGGYDYHDGLSERELEILRSNMFGPGKQRTITPDMARLFKSFVELSFPQEAFEKAVKDAQTSGKDIERDHQGLPVNLRMASEPPARTPSSSHQMTLRPIDASHFPQPPSQSSQKHACIDPRSDVSRKHDQVPTSAHACGKKHSTESGDADSAIDDSEDIPQQIRAAMDTPQGAGKEQATQTTGTNIQASQVENVACPVPTPQPTEPIDIPGSQTPTAPSIAHHPVFTAEVSPPVTVPVFPPGLMPVTNAARTSCDLTPIPTSSALTEPQPPLRTVEEVEAFARTRARNYNLPQVPTEPPGPAWTPGELLWREQMMRRNEYVLEAMAQRERDRLRAEAGLRKALGSLGLDAVDSVDENDDVRQT